MINKSIRYSTGYRHFVSSSKYYCPFCSVFITELGKVHSCQEYFDYLKDQEFKAQLYTIAEEVIDDKLAQEAPKFSPKVQKVVI